MGLLAQVSFSFITLQAGCLIAVPSIPAATLPLVIDMIALPQGFPHHNTVSRNTRISWSSLRQLDLLGAILFLGLSIMFVTALQGADIMWAWSSPATICLLVFSGACATLFIFWERFISLHWKDIVPVLTWKFTTRRCLGMFMYVSPANHCLLLFVNQILTNVGEGAFFLSVRQPQV